MLIIALFTIVKTFSRFVGWELPNQFWKARPDDQSALITIRAKNYPFFIDNRMISQDLIISWVAKLSAISELQFKSKTETLRPRPRCFAPRTLFENYSKCRIWIWHFRTIFVLLKLTCLVTLFDFKFNELLTIQIVNVACFARNAELDFFVIFKHRVAVYQ